MAVKLELGKMENTLRNADLTLLIEQHRRKRAEIIMYNWSSPNESCGNAPDYSPWFYISGDHRSCCHNCTFADLYVG
jgi:hypothetical protein